MGEEQGLSADSPALRLKRKAERLRDQAYAIRAASEVWDFNEVQRLTSEADDIDAVLNAARVEGCAMAEDIPLLTRIMRAVDGPVAHRDGAGLDIRAHPVFDHVREYLAARSEGLHPPVGVEDEVFSSLGASKAPSSASAGVAETPSEDAQ